MMGEVKSSASVVSLCSLSFTLSFCSLPFPLHKHVDRGVRSAGWHFVTIKKLECLKQVVLARAFGPCTLQYGITDRTCVRLLVTALLLGVHRRSSISLSDGRSMRGPPVWRGRNVGVSATPSGVVSGLPAGIPCLWAVGFDFSSARARPVGGAGDNGAGIYGCGVMVNRGGDPGA